MERKSPNPFLRAPIPVLLASFVVAAVGFGVAWGDVAETSDLDGGGEAEAGAEASPPGGTTVELPVPGFEPAVVVTPDTDESPPWRLFVVLHGNMDRPEWECGTWKTAAAPRGWLLCPRGAPRDDLGAGADRWTYESEEAAAAEISAGVKALAEAWPDRVRTDDAVLIGFSRGAHLGRAAASAADGVVFRTLVLVEGGGAVRSSDAREAAAAGVERVVYVCGGRTPCDERAARATRTYGRAGIEVQTVIMPEVGHAYAEDFDPIAEDVLQRALGTGDS